ncbi:MAG: methyltransferase [Pseudomonadota bacterium]
MAPLALGDRLWQRVVARLTDAESLARLARMPIARWFARRDATRLFDLVAGFTYSQVLMACVTGGVLDALRDGPRTEDALVHRTGLAPERLTLLLRAAQALDLVRPAAGGQVMLGRLGAACLGVPGLTAMVAHHRALYDDLRDPMALLAGPERTELADVWAYVHRGGIGSIDAQIAADYSRLMSESQAAVARETLAQVDLSRARALLDVGGGQGMFLRAVAQAAPHLRLGLFDLPQVVAGLGLPAEVFGGNFKEDALPQGFDTISLVRVLFDHSDADVAALLARVRAALPPGGRLIISEPMAGDRQPGRAGDVYYALYTAAMITGRTRRPQDITAALGAAGFAVDRVHADRSPEVTRVIEAHVPAPPAAG